MVEVSRDIKMAAVDRVVETPVEQHAQQRIGIAKCQTCSVEPSKYRCPRCSALSCSLPCIKQHKDETGCSGQRDKTAYVALKDFTDRHLHSDYHFLEDVDRTISRAVRERVAVTGTPPSQRRQVQQLKKEAKRRGIFFYFMSYGMSKREDNTSYFDNKLKKLFWKVHWKFPVCNVEFTEDRLCEDTTLQDHLARHLCPTRGDPWTRCRLKAYHQCGEGMEGVEVLMRAERTRSRGVRYHLLDVGKTLRENLSQKCVMEYPEFHVVLKGKREGFNVIEQGRRRGRDRPPVKKECLQDYRRCEDHDTSLNSRVDPVTPERLETQQRDGTELPSYFSAALAGDTSSPHHDGSGLETEHSPVESGGLPLNAPPPTQTMLVDESWSDQEVGPGNHSPSIGRGNGSHGNLVPYTDSEVEDGELRSDEET